MSRVCFIAQIYINTHHCGGYCSRENTPRHKSVFIMTLGQDCLAKTLFINSFIISDDKSAVFVSLLSKYTFLLKGPAVKLPILNEIE